MNAIYIVYIWNMFGIYQVYDQLKWVFFVGICLLYVGLNTKYVCYLYCIYVVYVWYMSNIFMNYDQLVRISGICPTYVLCKILTPVTLPSRYGISRNIVVIGMYYSWYIPYLDGNVTGVKILHKTDVGHITDIRTNWSYVWYNTNICVEYLTYLDYIWYMYGIFQL